MEPYIHQKHNRIHIVDLRETIKGLLRAQHFLTNLVEAGHEVIFVGTKAQAKEIVEAQAKRCGMHWVTHRWLGGTLTNFHTIRSRLRRLEELERIEADGSIQLRSKKEISSIRRERRKIQRNLEGIRKMARLPGAIIVSDIRRDEIAVDEARTLGIPVVAIVDTDCDPRLVDLVIPGNDDAFRSIEVLLAHLSDAVVAGRDKLVIRQAEDEKRRASEEAEARRKAQERALAAAADAKAKEEAAASSASAKAD
jgi:small subunit ribosomal protein S2